VTVTGFRGFYEFRFLGRPISKWRRVKTWAAFGVSKYYISPIGKLSLLTATATAARVHSLH